MKAKIFNIQKFSLHDGRGIRTCVFFSGCNLACKWCANPECRYASDIIGKSREYESAELLHEVLKDKVFYDKSGGGVTLTGGEIFMQYDFVKHFCFLLRENNVDIAVETAGAVESQKFRELAEWVDFIYIDCKHYDPAVHQKGTGVSNELILKNIEWLVGNRDEYCVRIPIIPHYNDAISDAQKFGELFQTIHVKNVELLPFHQFGEEKYQKLKMDYEYAGVKQLHKEDLEEYASVLRSKGICVILK